MLTHTHLAKEWDPWMVDQFLNSARHLCDVGLCAAVAIRMNDIFHLRSSSLLCRGKATRKSPKAGARMRPKLFFFSQWGLGERACFVK